MSENTILVCLAGYAFLVVLFIAEGLYSVSEWLWKRWKGILGVGMVLFLAGSARADTLTSNQIAQEIKQQSSISLRQNVAGFWADNLLAAQNPLVCDYCSFEPDSLQLSINSVLKAIGIEQNVGVVFCNLTNCLLVNAQSTEAVDDRVTTTITPTFLRFSAPVSTPEPSESMFIAFGFAYWLLFATCVLIRQKYWQRP
jgi:hypothetical protein